MCLYVSVLNMESSYLTSIHFQTSIPAMKETKRQREERKCDSERATEGEKEGKRGWILPYIQEGTHRRIN